jgi:hypothetical protein
VEQANEVSQILPKDRRFEGWNRLRSVSVLAERSRTVGGTGCGACLFWPKY